MIQTLRKKFVMVNMLLVTIIIVAVFVTVGVTNVAVIRQSGQQSLHMFINIFGSNQQRFQFEQGRTGSAREQFYLNDLGTAFVVEQYGKVLLVQGFVETEVDAQALFEVTVAMEAEEGILKDYNLRYLRQTTPDGIKIAFANYSNEQAQVRRIIFHCIGFSLLAIGLFLIVSLFLSGWALRPVEKAWQQQRQFLSDASHELKTPLTVILANTGIMQKRENQTEESLEKWLKSTELEGERMKSMVEQMLFLAKSDEDKLEQAVGEQINLSALVEEAVLSFEAVSYEAHTVLESSVEPDITIFGSRESLFRLINILLDNAVKYAAEPKQVSVTLRTGDKVVLQVRNTSLPVSEDQLKQMFDRFYRAEEARSASGFGLGLPIAQTIAEAHGGKIIASYEKDMMTFEVRFS